MSVRRISLSDVSSTDDLIKFSNHELELLIEGFVEGKNGNNQLLQLLFDTLERKKKENEELREKRKKAEDAGKIVKEIIEAFFVAIPYSCIEVSPYLGTTFNHKETSEVLGITEIEDDAMYYQGQGDGVTLKITSTDGIFKSFRNPFHCKIDVDTDAEDTPFTTYPEEWWVEVVGDKVSDTEFDNLKKIRDFTKPLLTEVDTGDKDKQEDLRTYAYEVLPQIIEQGVSKEDWDKVNMMFILSEDINYFKQLIEA